MITLYSGGVPSYPLEGVSNLCITRLYDGNDTLSFDISPQHQLYQLLGEECKIGYLDQVFIVKAINERTETASIDCELDLYDFKKTFHKTYSKNGLSVVFGDILDDICARTGWHSVGTGTVTQRQEVQFEEMTDYDVLASCQELYSVSYAFNHKEKSVTVIEPHKQTAQGVYLTDELNLESVSFKGDTNQFVTRLYAYGKDGLTIESVNSGKPYLDNNSYSDEIVSAVWKDTGIESAQELKEAAEKQLQQLAVPVRSYECRVIDLARLNSDYQSLKINIFSVVTLIDRVRKTRVDHQVVEYKEYPLDPMSNVVTLSNVKKTIKGSIDSVHSQVQEEIDATKSSLEQAIERATGLITDLEDSYITFVTEGDKNEIIIADQKDYKTAQNIWRWNIDGLGHSKSGYNGRYTMAMTKEDEIVADRITSGTLNADRIRSGRISAGSGKTWIDMDNGSFSFNNGQLSLQDGNLYMSGHIESTSGNLAGWDLTGMGFIGQDGRTGMCATPQHANIAFWAGGTSSTIGTSNVRIYHDGLVCAGKLESNQLEIPSETGGILLYKTDVDNLAIRGIKEILLTTNAGVRVVSTRNQYFTPVHAKEYWIGDSHILKSSQRAYSGSALSVIAQGTVYEYDEVPIEDDGPAVQSASTGRIGLTLNQPMPADGEEGQGPELCLNDLISVLWKAIQEQQEQIESLTTQVTAFKGRLDAAAPQSSGQ